MKVLHILNELKHSGAEVMLESAHERFKISGIECHVLSTGTTIGDYAVILQRAGYEVHHIPFRRTPAFLFDIMSLLMRERFAVVHIHTERAFFWYVMLAKLSNVPTTVRTFHNVFLFSHYLRWKRTLQRKASSKLFGAVHAAISDSVATIEKERFDNNCILIRNWTDVEKFRPPSENERARAKQRHQLKPNDFTVLTVGACSPTKNHFAAFAAIKKANSRLNGKRIVFLHIGSGPSLQEEKLYASRNGIEEYCRFIGIVDDVRPCLYAADAFVMTSAWEGLPIATIEAMSTGLPGILYNVYGLKDLLQDGRGGLLIEPNEDRLVDALLLLAQNPELKKLKAQEAREVILRNYQLEGSVDKLVRIYTRRHPLVVHRQGSPQTHADDASGHAS